MEHIFDTNKSPRDSPKPSPNPRPGSISLTPAQLQAALNSNLSASQKNTLQLMMMQSKKSAVSPVNRSQPVNQRSQQHASAVMAMHRMAQQLVMQVNKVDEALKNPNLGAEERERFLGFKAKFESDLQQLRNSANNQNFVNAASKMGMGPSNSSTSSTIQPTKIHPRSGAAFPLPTGPPMFPPCPQLSSKIFSSPMHSILEYNQSLPLQTSALISPTFKPRARADKIPREATIVEVLSGSSKKRKLGDLFKKSGFSEELDTELEKAFLTLADNFIDKLIYQACQAAKHRNSSRVEIKDFQLELERQWNLYIPGYSDEVRGFRKPILHSVHSSRQAIVSRSKHETAASARSKAILESESKTPKESTPKEEETINSEIIDRDL